MKVAVTTGVDKGDCQYHAAGKCEACVRVCVSSTHVCVCVCVVRACMHARVWWLGCACTTVSLNVAILSHDSVSFCASLVRAKALVPPLHLGPTLLGGGVIPLKKRVHQPAMRKGMATTRPMVRRVGSVRTCATHTQAQPCEPPL